MSTPVGWHWQAIFGGEVVNSGVVWEIEKPNLKDSVAGVEFEYEALYVSPSAQLEILQQQIQDAVDLLSEADSLLPKFGGNSQINAWKVKFPQFIKKIEFKEINK